ncbi:MAG: arginine repressor [Acidimicrobiales bacterium]
MRLSKAARQHRIALIIERQAVTSQVQLVDLLAGEGVEATQVTISRDLEEMGAVKVRGAGQEPAYAVPELPRDRVLPGEHLRRVLGEWVVEIGASANLVVVRTPPGSAHVVASALDRAGLPEIMGTVAGDDTVLAVTSTADGGEALAGRLAELAGL